MFNIKSLYELIPFGNLRNTNLIFRICIDSITLNDCLSVLAEKFSIDASLVKLKC